MAGFRSAQRLLVTGLRLAPFRAMLKLRRLSYQANEDFIRKRLAQKAQGAGPQGLLRDTLFFMGGDENKTLVLYRGERKETT